MVDPMTPMEPVFQDPPPAYYQGAEWQPTVDALIASTGRWALIHVGPYMDEEAERLIGRIRTARGVWSGHTWEAVLRTIGGTRTVEQRRAARTHVYARHLAAGGEGRG